MQLARKCYWKRGGGIHAIDYRCLQCSALHSLLLCFVMYVHIYICAVQAEPGSTIKFERVLAAKENGAFSSGRPYLENATVEAEILEELKGEKVIVYKMKPKKHYQRKNGHRQPLTKFLVTKIQT